MNLHRLNREITLYILAFALALGLRLYHLGAAPLSDDEAGWALQALQVARPEMSASAHGIGPQPAYIFLTGATFILFGASDFTTRLWPALAGSLLVLAPFCFRRDLGRLSALILAFGLALDPGLTTVSRQAGGPMLALAAAMFALGLWRLRKPLLAGGSAGLALLSGPAIVQGALAIALAWGFTSLAGKRASAETPDSDAPPGPESAPEEKPHSGMDPNLRQAIIGAVVVILVLGSFFFLHPQGLAAWFGALPAYLAGWTTPSNVPSQRILAALAFFQPFALIVALVTLVRRLIVERLDYENFPYTLVFPMLWALYGLFLILFYPGRQVSDLVWVLAPVWVLAACELERYLPDERLNPISVLQAALILILGALFWNSLITTNQIVPPLGVPWAGVRAAILLGILALGGLTTALVALGWTWEVSRNGLIWGLAAAFSIYSLAALWGASVLRPNQPSELWGAPPGAGQARLFSATLKDLSNWTTGMSHSIDVVSTLDAPTIRWALRDYPNARFNSEIPAIDPSAGGSPTGASPAGNSPAILITRQEAQPPALTDAYRGQDFVWWRYPGWQGALPEDFSSWLAFRQAPQVDEKIILWVRSDLFPGGVLDPSLGLNPTQ
jgi:hypothetical protein